MAKGKSLQLPAPPTYQTDSTFQQGNKSLLDYGQNLSGGNLPSWLNSTINPNNSANALSQAQGILQPQFRDTLTQISNQAAGAGQLESSTFTDALARSQSDLNSQYQSIVSGQAINDANQANNNKLGLFGMGLQSLQQATGFGQSNQNNQNSFNLQNYDNLVANAIQNNQNSNKANGWQQFFGAMNPLAHDYLQSQGINSVPGYGLADTAKIAAPFVGASMGMPGLGMGGGGGLGSTSAPGQYASNGLIGATGQSNSNLYEKLFGRNPIQYSTN